MLADRPLLIRYPTIPTAREPAMTIAAARKSRVVFVGHLAGDQLFGAERSLLQLLAAVDRSAYDLSCVLPGDNDDYLRAVGQYTTNITVFPYHWWSAAQPSDQDAVARFEDIFRREGADLVHVNTITLMDPLLAARRLKVPSVVHARELVSQDEDLAAHFGDDPSRIVNTVRAASDFIIANSEATHRLYDNGDRSFRLYNCVDLDHFDLPNDVEPGKLKVGILSNNQRRKGIGHFVNLATMAAHLRRDLEFFVIGPRTEHTKALEHGVRDAGVPVNLRFSGYVADPAEAIRQVNVVVSFSLAAESFGRTIAEAMAARRPVIAYEWGAAPELVRHGTDGFLIPYLDFTKALEHLGTLADHPDRLMTMGCNGRERAERLFAPAVFAAQLNGIYRQILGA
jgi:glycosyltransferase involved in cell wall biosynthesis